MSKSDVMREMYFKDGKDVAQISKEMGCVYSYVYGVIERASVKSGVEMREKLRGKTAGDSKSARIRELYKSGLEISDICREFVKDGIYVNNSYVWSVVNKVRKEG